jgi:dihydroorotase
MDLVIKNGRIIDPARKLDTRGDVHIAEGRIKACGASIQTPPAAKETRVFDAAGKIVVPGLIDMHVHLREPGQEYKEDIASGTAAAAAGGFTTVCCMPNTIPANDCRAVTNLILERARAVGGCRVLPIGAMTKGRAGKELAEIGEMVECGVVAVSDDGVGVADGGLMRRVLEYAKTFGVVAIQHCEDRTLSRGAVMHEGVQSARAGLSGQPAVAESAMLYRDIALCRITGCPYHAAHVSTAESVALVREAKKEGLPVTAEATVHHLSFTDALCLQYDTNTKVNPPLRTERDRKALRQALAEGVVDALVTDHAPHTSIEKAVEYDFADFGIIGLELAVPLGLALVEENVLDLPALVARWTSGPARVLGLETGTLEQGRPADVTVLDPAAQWTVEPATLRSKASNTPLLGQAVRGRAVLTVCDGAVVHEVGA